MEAKNLVFNKKICFRKFFDDFIINFIPKMVGVFLGKNYMSGFNIFSNKLNNLFSAFNKSSKEDCEKNNNDDVGKDNISVNDENSYLTTNRSLWRAVILQSIIDILNNSSRTENKIAKIEAKQWMFKDNDDFHEVCNLAGYNARYVRKKVMEIMRQNLVSKIIINKMYKDKEEKFSLNINNLSASESHHDQFFSYEKKVIRRY